MTISFQLKTILIFKLIYVQNHYFLNYFIDEKMFLNLK